MAVKISEFQLENVGDPAPECREQKETRTSFRTPGTKAKIAAGAGRMREGIEDRRIIRSGIRGQIYC